MDGETIKEIITGCDRGLKCLSGIIEIPRESRNSYSVIPAKAGIQERWGEDRTSIPAPYQVRGKLCAGMTDGKSRYSNLLDLKW
jgi:hypothetical protein